MGEFFFSVLLFDFFTRERKKDGKVMGYCLSTQLPAEYDNDYKDNQE